MQTPEFFVEAAAPEHADALARLFAEEAYPCHCRYWHFEGERNAWLERCAFTPERNEAEMRQALARQSDDGRGLVAVAEDGPIIGWLKLAPAAAMRKHYDQRLYRKLPCFEGNRAGVFTIGCLLVHPSFRKRGVARALISAAVRLAPAWGARALEAFPRRVPEGAHDADLFMGPEGVYLENGFRVVDEIGPYPILRRELSEP